MIVTTRATERHGGKGLAEDIDLILDSVRFILDDIDWGMRSLAEIPESGSLNGFVQSGFIVNSWISHQVASHMFDDETVVGDIFVEGADDPVPVPPCMRDRIVKLMAACFRVSHKVQPVPTPVLTEVGGLEEIIDQITLGLIRIDLDCLPKPQDSLRFRWEAEQIEMYSSQPDFGYRLRGWFHICRFEIRQDEGIDRISNPVFVGDLGHLGVVDRLPCPVFGPRCPFTDPVLNQLQLLRFEWRTGWWHSVHWIGCHDPLQKQTRVGVARDHDNAAATFGSLTFGGIQSEPGFSRFGIRPVTGVAPCGQQASDFGCLARTGIRVREHDHQHQNDRRHDDPRYVLRTCPGHEYPE